MIEHDDLSDVILEGKALVSDDPTTWLIPKSLADAPDLNSWWDQLVEMDDAVSAAVAALGATPEEICDTVDTYLASRGDTWKRRRHYVTQLLLWGVGPMPISRLTGLPLAEVMADLGGEARFEGLELLRQGALHDHEIAARIGVDTRVVSRWADLYQLQRPTRSVRDDVRAEAIRLVLDEGMTAREAALHLKALHPAENLTKYGVQQAVYRHKQSLVAA